MVGWSTERIEQLAPDASSAQAGLGLAKPARWRTLGQADHVIWGECQGSGSVPYQTQIDLREPAFRCSCPSRKFPCKHALGLFLLYVEQRSALAAGSRPLRVAEWLEARGKKVEQKTQKSRTAGDGETTAVADSAAQAKRAAGREARVAAGLDELKRWLLDLVRQGLASVPGRPYGFWESVAARMVDAQAPGVA